MRPLPSRKDDIRKWERRYSKKFMRTMRGRIRAMRRQLGLVPCVDLPRQRYRRHAR